MAGIRYKVKRAQGETPAVSIIVPVFNALLHLQECISSLQAQTLASIEFVFVDDRSTDGSFEFLQDIVAVDPRARLCRLERNRGPGVARNLGIEAAAGRYLRFVDSDDIAPAASTATLWQVAEASGADLVRGNCRVFRDGSARKIFPPNNILEVNNREGLVYREDNFHGMPLFHQLFLFEAEFLRAHGLRYPSLRLGEDPVFLLRALLRSSKAGTVGDVVYRYRAYKHIDDRFKRPAELSAYLDHYLQVKKLWLRENRAQDWWEYFAATFWWLWKHFLEPSRQNILQHFDKLYFLLSDASELQLDGGDFIYSQELVRAIRAGDIGTARTILQENEPKPDRP